MPVIEKVEELEDRVKIHLHFSNGMHIPDENRFKEILYENILLLASPPKLPEQPHDHCATEYWEESFDVEKVGGTVVYHFKEFQETVSSRMQIVHGGPYLRKNEQANP
ncbi:MAG: hypothetical protein ABIH72_01770 [archaeon]